MTVARRSPAHVVYLAFVGCVVITSFLVVRSNGFAEHTDLLSLAVTLDIVLLVPGVYLLAAIRMGWRKVTVIPVFVLSLACAHLVLPASGEHYLKYVEFALVPIELFVLAFVVIKARQLRHEYRAAKTESVDFLETIEQVLGRIIDHPRVVQIIATELSLIHYGLLSWRNRPRYTTGGGVFTYHEKSGNGLVLGVFLVLIAIEVPALHLLLGSKFPTLAWVLTALGLYGVVFILGDFNATRLRPIRIHDSKFDLKIGLRWRCTIPLSEIDDIEATTFDIEDRDGLLNCVVIGNQNLVIRLKRPHTATGIYGFEREFDRIAIAVDEPALFSAALTCDGASPEDTAEGS